MEIALFFTRGISLAEWNKRGLLAREKQVYERLLDSGTVSRVYWLTYGSEDVRLAKLLQSEQALHPNIHVLEMPAFFASKYKRILYSFIAPLFHRKPLSNCSVFKTNQMDGAWTGVIAKLLFHKKLWVRTGYTLSQLELLTNGPTLRHMIFKNIERLVYRFAEIATVSSAHNKSYLQSIDVGTPIEIMPNYVDTEQFYPAEAMAQRRQRVLTVGRLVGVKNYEALIRAAAAVNIGLDIYGDGELKNELQRLVTELQADVQFCGVVQNAQLPDIMRQYQYYVISSLTEGMPKALLEAMACGCVCMGTNVNGVNEVLQDGQNGILAGGVDEHALSIALERLQRADKTALAAGAVQTIKERYSLLATTLHELGILQQCAGTSC